MIKVGHIIRYKSIHNPENICTGRVTSIVNFSNTKLNIQIFRFNTARPQYVHINSIIEIINRSPEFNEKFYIYRKIQQLTSI